MCDTYKIKVIKADTGEVVKTLEAAFAPAQHAAQQWVAYAAPPDEGEPWRGLKFKEVQRGCWRRDCGKTIKEVTSDQSTPASGGNYPVMPKRYTVDDDGEELFTAEKMRAFADATCAMRASHGQASSQAGEDPALVCDYCGALTPDPWHSSGMLHGKMSKHIHSCDACAARGAAQAQDTREPLTPEQIQDLLLCGNPTDEEMRLIRIGWDAANGIKGGQHVS